MYVNGRHYAELIFRLQREAQTELRRLAEENKAHEEVAENLRDKIASQTVKKSPPVFWQIRVAYGVGRAGNTVRSFVLVATPFKTVFVLGSLK